MAIKNTVPLVARDTPTCKSNKKKDLSNINFGFSLCSWLIPRTFVNTEKEGIVLRNHSPREVASDKW